MELHRATLLRQLIVDEQPTAWAKPMHDPSFVEASDATCKSFGEKSLGHWIQPRVHRDKSQCRNSERWEIHNLCHMSILDSISQNSVPDMAFVQRKCPLIRLQVRYYGKTRLGRLDLKSEERIEKRAWRIG